MSTDSVDPTTLAGDPFALAGTIKAQEELLDAAEAVLAWLDDRQLHIPIEMLDGPEWKHRRALHAAVRKVREAGRSQ